MYIKCFDKDLKCRGFQFEVGGVYDTGYKKEELELCSETVFHFFDSLEKVNEYYSCRYEGNRYCEIEVLGELIYDNEKCGSNKIKILREITGEELDNLKGNRNGNTGLFNSGGMNSGDWNSGNWNTGNRNSGNCNSGERNSGKRNSGDCNSGYWNSGNCNSGDMNSGDWNSGDCNSGNVNSGNCNIGDLNSGDCNSGNRNSGYWNKCNESNGVFCTEEPTIRIFDKDTNMTLREFIKSKYNRALRSVKLELTKWIEYTEEEKKEDDKKRLIGGYLKEYSYKEACANWWSELTEENREIIKSIPNFDADKFEEITGINID